MLTPASVSLAHTNVSGHASAQSCDRSEPGTTSVSGNDEGTNCDDAVAQMPAPWLEAEGRPEENKAADAFRSEGRENGCQCAAQRVAHDEGLHATRRACDCGDGLADGPQSDVSVAARRWRPLEKADAKTARPTVAHHAYAGEEIPDVGLLDGAATMRRLEWGSPPEYWRRRQRVSEARTL